MVAAAERVERKPPVINTGPADRDLVAFTRSSEEGMVQGCLVHSSTSPTSRTMPSLDPPPMVPASTSMTTPPPPKTARPSKGKLPKLPIPKLEDSMRRYLRALEGLQDPEEHAKTSAVVKDFLDNGEGAKWQERLEEYDEGVDSYIEEFWCGFFPLCLCVEPQMRAICHSPTRLCYRSIPSSSSRPMSPPASTHNSPEQRR